MASRSTGKRARQEADVESIGTDEEITVAPAQAYASVPAQVLGDCRPSPTGITRIKGPALVGVPPSENWQQALLHAAMRDLRVEGLSAADLELYFYWQLPHRRNFAVVGAGARMPAIDDGFFYIARRGGDWPETEHHPFLHRLYSQTSALASSAPAAAAAPVPSPAPAPAAAAGTGAASAGAMSAAEVAAIFAAAAQAVVAASSAQPRQSAGSATEREQDVDPAAVSQQAPPPSLPRGGSVGDRRQSTSKDNVSGRATSQSQRGPASSSPGSVSGESAAERIVSEPSSAPPTAPGPSAGPSQPAAAPEIQVFGGESITEAVARAAPGQTVRLAPGQYKEKLVLNKDVHIVGPPDAEAVLEWDKGPTLHCTGPAAPSVKGITIRCSAPEWPAIWITGGSRAAVENCDVSSTCLSGIEVRDEGTAPTLRGNTVHDCGQAGIVFRTSAKGVAEGNDVFGNANAGIGIATGADPVVRANKVHDDKQGGILVYENGRGTVEGNDVYGNARAGIAISTGADPVVKGNKVHDGMASGILVAENGRGTVEGNDVFGNANSGIAISTGADPVVRGNKVHDGKQGGIFVYENGRGTVEGNDVYGNASSGIQIREGADPVVRGNRVRNQQFGIYVYEGGKGTVSGNTIERISDPSFAPCGGVKVLDGCTPVVQGNTFRP
eukprot:tig00000157_g9696.t1